MGGLIKIFAESVFFEKNGVISGVISMVKKFNLTADFINFFAEIKIFMLNNGLLLRFQRINYIIAYSVR